MTDKFADIIARELNIRYNSVANTLQLLNEGCTIPFISRYRKERTGGLDEVSISAISDMGNKLNEIAKRKETIIKTITEQGKMTPEIKARIDSCWVENELEDIYLPVVNFTIRSKSLSIFCVLLKTSYSAKAFAAFAA